MARAVDATPGPAAALPRFAGGLSGRAGPLAIEPAEEVGEPPLGLADTGGGIALGRPRPLPDPLLAVERTPAGGGEVAEPGREPGRLLAKRSAGFGGERFRAALDRDGGGRGRRLRRLVRGPLEVAT
jgi:hypothetical protein